MDKSVVFFESLEMSRIAFLFDEEEADVEKLMGDRAYDNVSLLLSWQRREARLTEPSCLDLTNIIIPFNHSSAIHPFIFSYIESKTHKRTRVFSQGDRQTNKQTNR